MINFSDEKSVRPCLGVIMLETQFPRIIGDVGNPDTFDFPVQYEIVKGASPEKIVCQSDRGFIQLFIEAGRSLIDRGAKVITTSCGFLTLFHNELNQALDVPFFSSSLQQVNIAKSIIRKDQKVGIITVSKDFLTPNHFSAIGIEYNSLVIVGMENAEEFTTVFIGGKKTLNKSQCHKEMADAAMQLKEMNSDIGAIVLECTNMPPYSETIRKVTGGLPIFDIVTMVNYAAASVGLQHRQRQKLKD